MSSTVKVSTAVSLTLEELVAVTVNGVAAKSELAEPVITPVLVLKVSPVGRLGEMDQETIKPPLLVGAVTVPNEFNPNVAL